MGWCFVAVAAVEIVVVAETVAGVEIVAAVAGTVAVVVGSLDQTVAGAAVVVEVVGQTTCVGSFSKNPAEF